MRTSVRLRIAAIWSGPRSRATSASPCSISRRCVAGSVTLRNNTPLSLGASTERLLASSTSTSLGLNSLSVNAPLPAELRFSHALPRSPACSLAITSFSSTMLPGRAASTLSTYPGPKTPLQATDTLPLGSLVTICAMLSLVQPSCARMKAGALFSLMTRRKEKMTSSARTGLPLANTAFGRSVNSMLLPSAPVFHEAATPGRILDGSRASYCTSGSYMLDTTSPLENSNAWAGSSATMSSMFLATTSVSLGVAASAPKVTSAPRRATSGLRFMVFPLLRSNG